MQFLTLLFVPHIIIWILTRSRRAYRWLLLVATFTIQLFAILPMAIIFIVVSGKLSTEVDNSVMLAGIYKNYQVTNASLHGLDGWQGVDIKAGCGEPIYAPFAATVTYNGLDGYNHLGVYEQATMLTIRNDDLELTLLHGDYLPEVGSQVRRAEMIGTENTHGWSTGCHSHVILKQNGRTVNYLDWIQENRVYAAGVGMDYPLRISWYDPSKCYQNGVIIKNTNCDSDPTTMASGDKVASWIGGRGGVYAAACPRSDGWHHGQRFELDGVIYECRDTGGWIACYQPGQLDRAIQNAHGKGYLLDVPAIVEQSYCWVDLLNGSQYQYGSLAYDWSLIR